MLPREEFSVQEPFVTNTRSSSVSSLTSSRPSRTHTSCFATFRPGAMSKITLVTCVSY